MDCSSAFPNKETLWKVRCPIKVRRHGLIRWNVETLSAKLLDPDEKVRAAVCKLYSQLDYETALHHASEAQLRRVAERGLDKKVSSSPFFSLRYLHVCSTQSELKPSIVLGNSTVSRFLRCELFVLFHSRNLIVTSENGDQGAIKQFSWIAQSLLQMTQSQEVK